MILHKIVSHQEWLKQRKALLAKEKELTRLNDELTQQRQALPWVKIEKDYLFETTSGRQSLIALFNGKSQLIVYHFMFDPDWEKGCMSCSFVADNFAGIVSHFKAYDTAFAAISRAPLSKILPFKKQMGWHFPWHSSYKTDFNRDFQVTLDEEHMFYNFTPAEERPSFMRSRGEWPGLSVFVRNEDEVFHTYSTYARGLDALLNTYQFLDLTPLGRQEKLHAPVGQKSASLRAARGEKQ